MFLKQIGLTTLNQNKKYLAFVFVLSLIIIGAGCKSGQYSQPEKNTSTSPTNTPANLTSTQNSIEATENTPEDATLKLVVEAKEKNNLIQYETASYQLMEKQNMLFFTLVTHEVHATSPLSDKTETALFMYNLGSGQVNKIVSSNEVPESLIFDIDNLSITFPTALPYLYVERATLSPNNRYLQLKTYDIIGGEWFHNHTILVDLETKKAKNIGRTEEFEWLGRNKFRYKSSIPYTKNCNMEVGPNVCFKAGAWETKQF